MPTMLRKTAVSSFFLLLLLLFLTSHGMLAAQQSSLPQAALGSQDLRPYWHVFAAYAIAIALVLAWVISIGRRLRDVEERLGE